MPSTKWQTDIFSNLLVEHVAAQVGETELKEEWVLNLDIKLLNFDERMFT